MFVVVLLLIAGVLALFSRLAGLDRRTRELEQRLEQLQHEAKAARRDAVAKTAAPVLPPSPALAVEPPEFDADSAAGQVPSEAPETSDLVSVPDQPPAADPSPSRPWTPTPVPESAAYVPAPEPLVVRWLREYFTGGNLVVRIGIIVLFFGVAFLLKYAAEHTRLPIEARLIGADMGALVLFGIGWRLRVRRRGFALSLQGGAVGILYLTVFAAFRLYHLVPSGYAFALLAVLGAASGLLALKQDSLSFAILGVAGGFMAPVLASTGQGSHVALFSYYALLDAGIVAMAWSKAWRPLNLLAFLFTFGIGTFWGVTRYVPAQFASTEPFLVFFALAFIAIAVLFALRRAPELTHYVDGTLVFGTPVVAMGLQMGLIRDIPYGRAFSALAAAAIYLALAWWLHRTRRATVRLLVESFLALGVALLTLAVPLALDGRWTAATWALEGAAIFWMGLRQGRRLPCVSGVLLQLAAGVAFLSEMSSAMARIPVINAHCLGALFISGAGLVCARLATRPSVLLQRRGEPLGNVLLAWGLAWWMYTGVTELQAFLPERWLPGAVLVLVALTAMLAGFEARRQSWPALRVPALLVLPAMVIAAAWWVTEIAHPFGAGGWVAWPLGFAAVWISLKWHEASLPRTLVMAMHVATLWLLAVLASWELHWQVALRVHESAVWGAVAWAIAPALMLAGLVQGVSEQRWPVREHRTTYRHWGGLGLTVLLMGWSVWLNIAADGTAAPLPYLPLLNPLDVAEGLVLLLVLRWLLSIWRASDVLGHTQRRLLAGVLVGVVFLWLNGVLLRTMHHWLLIPYQLDALLAATEVQTALSIFWTLLALGAMLWANRSAQRLVWFGGAGLMGIVLAKLFLVDLARIGTVPRIVSFLGVGALMLVIGYYSPLPPDVKEEHS